MPFTVASARSFRTYDAWQTDRLVFTPRKSHAKQTASVVAPEGKNAENRGWAALVASAHDAYMRDRQMTTEERVELELRKLAQKNQKNETDVLSGTTALSPKEKPKALTASALEALEQEQKPRDDSNQSEIRDNGAEEVVPSMNYAVAELAKSLEETRKALRKATRDNEELRRQNDKLTEEWKRTQDLEAQLRKFDDWISPSAHADLRTGWEEWADVAEKKIESLQSKLGKANEENETLQAKIMQKQTALAKLEERVNGYHDWTSPHERAVLDATISMLQNNLNESEAEKENCHNCAQRQAKVGRKSALGVTKPMIGRQKTVA